VIGAARFGELAAELENVADSIRRSVNDDLADAEASARHERRLILLGVIGAGTLAATVGAFLTRGVTRGVRSVATAARAMAAGDLSTRADVTTSDEVGLMAHAFNRMAEQLSTTMTTLEQVSRENELILNTAGDGIFRIGTDGTLNFLNPAGADMIGCPVDELVGKPAHASFHHSHADGTPYPSSECPIYRAASSGEPSGFVEEVFWRRDGSCFPVEYVATPVVVDGRPSGAVVIFRDVARRKQAEEALAAARDEAIEASRLKSEFLATMSHEIRTPMNGVIGLTGLLLDTELSVTQRQYAEGVRSAGEALLNIINDILDFSKIEAGKVDLEVIEYEVRQVVEETADLLAEAARTKGIELISYCYPDVPVVVRGDPGRLRQVLINLVGNAVKFTDQGEVVVRGRLDGRADDRASIRFEVIDTGIGIAPEVRDRLFDPFSQADASTTRRFGGTGLGLAVARQLVELMGGEVGVESELGKGSMFWFTLPLEVVEGAVARPEPAAHALAGVRALVVDDNATNRLILAEQMKAWGMEAVTAASAGEALDILLDSAGKADRERPQLGVLDLHMPETDGLELARRITEDQRLQGLPMILLSSGGGLDVGDYRAAGIRMALNKPVRQSQLFDSLMRVMGPQPDGGGESPAAAARRATGKTLGRVLVVEDNPINQTVAAGILAKLGYNSDVAANGIEALDALARREYDAVLMDCQMPEMDGYEATVELRRREAGARRVPVIAMTAAAMEGDRDRALAAGMDDYVPKPVRADELQRALRQWVSRDGESGDGEPPQDSVSDGPPVLDRARLAVLETLSTPEEDLVGQLLQSLRDRVPTDVERLRAAATSGDSAAAGYEAHGLKGSAANLGANALAEACAVVEERGDAGDIDGVRRALPAVEAAAGRLAAELDEELRRRNL
jgi:two-component system, sensor histidine kinase and response regulator